MFSSVSILIPNAFSIRNAISADKAALPLMRSDRVARRTSNTFAASLTLKPSSSRISSQMNAPGCGGAIPILAGARLISGSPPGRGCRFRPAGYRRLAANAPRPGTVGPKLVHAPAGRPGHAAYVGRRDQHREDVEQPPHKIVAEFPAVVVFDEAQQAAVPDAPNDHACRGVRLYRTPSKWRITVVWKIHAI